MDSEFEEIVKGLLTEEQKKTLLRIGWATAKEIAKLKPSDISLMLKCSRVKSSMLIQRARNLLKDGIAEPFYSPFGKAVKISIEQLSNEDVKRIIDYIKGFYDKLNMEIIIELNENELVRRNRIRFGKKEVTIGKEGERFPLEPELRRFFHKVFMEQFCYEALEKTLEKTVDDVFEAFLPSHSKSKAEKSRTERLLEIWYREYEDLANRLADILTEVITTSARWEILDRVLSSLKEEFNVCKVWEKDPDPDLRKYLELEYPENYIAIKHSQYLILIGEAVPPIITLFNPSMVTEKPTLLRLIG